MPEPKNKIVNPLKTSRLTAEEVCAMIEACSKSQVRELKFAGLHLSFNPQVEQAVIEWSPQETAGKKVSDSEPKTPDTEISDQAVAAQAQDTLEHEELRAKEQQLDELPLTSPLDYEKAMASGDLEDARFDKEA